MIEKSKLVLVVFVFSIFMLSLCSGAPYGFQSSLGPLDKDFECDNAEQDFSARRDLCEECGRLFDDTGPLCSQKCFSTPYFTHCIEILQAPMGKLTKPQRLEVEISPEEIDV